MPGRSGGADNYRKWLRWQSNSGQLAGKVVIITGGAGGLGAAFARHIIARGGKRGAR